MGRLRADEHRARKWERLTLYNSTGHQVKTRLSSATLAEIDRQMRPVTPESAMPKQVQKTKSGTVKATSVAEYIVARLAAEGISDCFGLQAIMCFRSAMQSTAAQR